MHVKLIKLLANHENYLKNIQEHNFAKTSDSDELE